MTNKKFSSFLENPIDYTLLITVLLLLTLGLIMVLSASSPSSLSTTGSSYTYVYKQAISAVIGITLMLIISKIDYRRYEKYYKIAYVFSVVILLLVLVPGLGRRINGALRWIKLPVFGSAQPSEITKLGLILFFAAYLSKNRDKLKHIWHGFLKPIIYFLAPPILILLLVQSHFSASVIIILVVSVMMISSIILENGK